MGDDGVDFGVQVPDLLEIILGPPDLAGAAAALHPAPGSYHD